jgi:molybdopterin-synthase adenylyltransferase
MLDPKADRQSFLGSDLPAVLTKPMIGVVGLSGGGSHIVQQLAHIGFPRYTLFDPKAMEEKHLHRVVGATHADVDAGTLKVQVGARLVRGIRPRAVVHAHACRWQERPAAIRACDVVIGCADTFADRQELEVCTRRYLIPYIDIGMDVTNQDPRPPRMAGQVFLSMPGAPCMFCLGLLNEENLAKEAQEYGAAGGRPQVVWANGVLASTAVGVLVDLLTDWTRAMRSPVHMEYDGNLRQLYDDRRLQFRARVVCPHHPDEAVGDPVLRSQ